MSETNGSVTERKAQIFNVQKYNMYDGPGIRTIVFFKGCPLRCQWCSNPESQRMVPEVLFKHDNCVHCGACVPVCPVGIHQIVAETGKHEVNRSIDCIGCRACEKACPASALSIVGEKKAISELLEIIEEDKPFYDISGGGLTLSGGEAMMQPHAVESLLAVCQSRGINTAIETCGYAKEEVLRRIACFTDLFLFDLKHMNSKRHLGLVGVRNEGILSNLKLLLNEDCRVEIRMPLLRGVNDSEEEIAEVIAFLSPYIGYKNFVGVNMLPYHKMGVNKYRQLDRIYPINGDPSLSGGDLDRIEAQFRQANFPVTVIRH